jgi:hypothetical protein
MTIRSGRGGVRPINCPDCVIAVVEPRNVTSRPGKAPVRLGEDEIRALGVLADAGLVPPPRMGPAGPRALAAPESWDFAAAKAS